MDATPSSAAPQHWSRFTWLVALMLVVLGAAVSYVVARSADDMGFAALLALYGLLSILILAACGYQSVRHHASVPATIATLFVFSMLAVPTFVGAAGWGLSHRVSAAADDLYSDWGLDFEEDDEAGSASPQSTPSPLPPNEECPAQAGADSPEQASRCLYDAWVEGEESRAEPVASAAARSFMFESTYEPPAWEFYGCSSESADQYLCEWYVPDDFHGVVVEMQVEDDTGGWLVTDVESYG